MRALLLFTIAAFPAPALHNGIRVLNPTGSTQLQIPYSTARMFAQGEIASSFACVKPYIGGVPAARWQCQKVNVWPDGSLKYALIDFVIPSHGTNGSDVDYRASMLTGEGGVALTKTAVLGASWEADMLFTYNTGTANEITFTRDLRTIFSALTENENCVIGTETSTTRKLRRRRDGPVLTEWIVEDLCSTVAYDFGGQWDGTKWVDSGSAYYSIHPYFVVTAYQDYPSPGNISVKVRFVVENPWTRKWQNQVYRQRLRAGNPVVVVEEQTIDYTHTAGSTYSFEGWATSSSVPQLIDDPNLPYLVHSKAIPAFVTEVLAGGITDDKMVPVELVKHLIESASGKLGVSPEDGGTELAQYCRASVIKCRQGTACCSFWTKSQQVGGASHELGMTSTQYLRWLYIVRNPDISVALKKDYWNQVVEPMMHAGANMPILRRESRSAAAYCASNCDTPAFQSANEFGRTISIDAHNEGSVSTWSPTFHAAPAGCSGAPCAATSNGWVMDAAHQPQPFYLPALLTGDFYYIRLLENLAAFQTGLSSFASTTSVTRNGKMGYLGWGGSTSSRWAAWRLRNMLMAAVLLPNSPEQENFLKQLKNTAGVEEGALQLSPSEALQYSQAAGSPYKYGEDLVRLKDSGGLTLTNVSNPMKYWEAVHRITGTGNIIHQADNYDATQINSGHAPWMIGYNMLSIGMYKDHGYPWFDAVMKYVPKLILVGLKKNPFLAVSFNIPTHKTSFPRKEVISATPVGSNTIEFEVTNHGYTNGQTVVICCTNGSWPNGWANVETSSNKDYGGGAVSATVASATTNTFRLTLSGWSNPTGTYPACCTVAGKYKLYVARFTVGTTTSDGGPFQSDQEYLDALHPRIENTTTWSTISPNRVYDRWGAYPDIMMAMLSVIIDNDLPDAADAKRVFSAIKANSISFDRVMSPGSNKNCNGAYTPTDSYCGNMTWMIWPRPRIEGLTVTPGATSIRFDFVAPTGDGARIGLTTSPAFTDSRDTNDTRVPCKGRSCSIQINGLNSQATYQYRITAGTMGGTARTQGSITTR